MDAAGAPVAPAAGRAARPRRALALIAALSLAQLVWAPPVAAASDLLPDLKMAPIYDLLLTKSNGHVRLRFGAIVWNIGLGPLEARGSDREGRKMNRLVQILSRSDGDKRSVTPLGVAAFYSGDGHDHWHIGGFVIASLYPRSMADTTVTGTVRHLRKIGFCLTNLVRVPEALRPANSGRRADYPYTGCGTSSSQRFKMGISVGWGDDYKQWFAHQSIDITGITPGEYRLCATPNANGAWLEVTRTNNSGWTDLYINPAKNQLRVLAQGESECQPTGSSFTAPTIYWPSGPGIAGGLTV